jgi:hypothetical protein
MDFFLTNIVLMCSNKGAVCQLLDDSGKHLQGCTNELGPCLQLRAVPWGQLVVPVTTVKCVNNLVVGRCRRNIVQNVRYLSLQDGEQVRRFFERCSVLLRHVPRTCHRPWPRMSSLQTWVALSYIRHFPNIHVQLVLLLLLFAFWTRIWFPLVSLLLVCQSVFLYAIRISQCV